MPGVWRLRLPLPWPGVPHCNAWALAAGDGIVLVDCGMDEPGSLRHLERALEQVGLRLEHVRLLVCTHAHVDHCGQAARGAGALRLRAVDPPAPRAPDARRRRSRRGAGAADRDRAPERRARGAAAALGGLAARPRHRHERAARPGARPAPRRRGADRPGRLAGASRRPATRPRTSCCTSPSAGCCSRATTCSAASRSTSTTAGRPTRWASSSARSTASRGSTCGSRCPATDARSRTCAGHVDGNRALVRERLDAVLRRAGRARRGDRVRPAARRLRRAADARDGRLAAHEDALLPRAPRAAGRACGGRRRRAGALARRLDCVRDADRRTDRHGLGAVVLLRVLPAAHRRGRAQPRPRARGAVAAEPARSCR